jgi:hypothetical protein
MDRVCFLISFLGYEACDSRKGAETFGLQPNRRWLLVKFSSNIDRSLMVPSSPVAGRPSSLAPLPSVCAPWRKSHIPALRHCQSIRLVGDEPTSLRPQTDATDKVVPGQWECVSSKARSAVLEPLDLDASSGSGRYRMNTPQSPNAVFFTAPMYGCCTPYYCKASDVRVLFVI